MSDDCYVPWAVHLQLLVRVWVAYRERAGVPRRLERAARLGFRKGRMLDACARPKCFSEHDLRSKTHAQLIVTLLSACMAGKIEAMLSKAASE